MKVEDKIICQNTRIITTTTLTKQGSDKMMNNTQINFSRLLNVSADSSFVDLKLFDPFSHNFFFSLSILSFQGPPLFSAPQIAMILNVLQQFLV